MNIKYEEYLTPTEREDRISKCMDERKNIICNMLRESAQRKAEISKLDLEIKLLTENGTYDDYYDGLELIYESTKDSMDRV